MQRAEAAAYSSAQAVHGKCSGIGCPSSTRAGNQPPHTTKPSVDCENALARDSSSLFISSSRGSLARSCESTKAATHLRTTNLLHVNPGLRGGRLFDYRNRAVACPRHSGGGGHVRARKRIMRCLRPVSFLGAIIASLLFAGACLRPPANAAAKAESTSTSADSQTDTSSEPTDGTESDEFYGPSWSDASGNDGKGGVKLSGRPADKRLPLRIGQFDRKRRGDASLLAHPEWLLLYGPGKKSVAYEWQWVTQGEQKHWDRLWAGGGIAFNKSWQSTDATGARYLVIWAKSGHEGAQIDLKVGLHSTSKSKGLEDTGMLSLADYAEGKHLGTQWARAVIPLSAFPNIERVDLASLQTVRFDVSGMYPENQLVSVLVDNIYLSDRDMVTPVENLGYQIERDELVLMWDKRPGEKITKFVVKAAGKELASVGADQRQVRIPLSRLGSATKSTVTVSAVGARETSSAIGVEVNLKRPRFELAAITIDPTPLHEISKYIYGTNYASAAVLRGAGLTVNRWGGNATSRYNWKRDLSNSAADWYFLNGFAKPEGTPESEKGYHKFIAETLASGADVNFTIPILPFIAKPHPEAGQRYCSYPASKYPEQERIGGEGCGNGVLRTGEKIWGNDPNVASIPNSPEFQKGLVESIRKSFGGANGKGVRFFTLDNEPGLWMHTHRDVAPKGLSTDELARLNEDYAAMIKSADPDAKVIGFASWGPKELAGSNLDEIPPGPEGYKHPGDFKGKEQLRERDRKAHGGKYQLISLLEAYRAMEKKHGKRLIDVVDIHWYPELYAVDSQGTKHRLCNETPRDPVIVKRHLEALREWYDATYAPDGREIESWTALPALKKDLWDPWHPVIPALKRIVEQTYPGTKLAIGEYTTGGEGLYHGAILRAIAWGIFLQADLYMAENWSQVDERKPLFFVQKLFGNYDDKGSRVGGRFVRSTSSSTDVMSFATHDDNRWQVMLINRSLENGASANIQLPLGTTRARSYAVSETTGLRLYQSSPKVGAGSAMVSLPPFSVMLVVLE